ncbi:hypothetical protein EJV47_17890 [Hymenobacter gummosus]|uniref:Lipoprotein n=1 Tax=Hymenobacter gummosus TaxID=1776032 RepID=A0A3S0K3J2_9BACT|nr:hypothetical protein [Hymenobacter gummosus]RTQ47793.1 hypothetical protein EJV47_17890 [Hymenobacter gummosus]
MIFSSTLHRTALAGLLALSSLAACKEDQDALNIACTGPGATTPDKLFLSPQEELSTSGRKLWLTARTQAWFPCANYRLPTTATLSGSHLTLQYGQPQEPTMCLTAPGFAGAQENITSLAPGSYTLRLQVGTRKTTGTLLVQPDRVELSTCDTNLVAVRHPLLRRVPVGTIWTRASSTAGTAAAEATVRSMRDSLLRLGAQPLALLPGYYGQFTLDASGNPVIDRSGYHPSAVLTSAVLAYSGPMARLQAYLDRHRANGLYVVIQADNGQQAH